MKRDFDLSVKIAGAAGFGIKVAGLMVSKAFMRHGLNVIDYTEYPSLIRGGHNVYFARSSSDELFSHRDDVNILVALNDESISLHQDELNDSGAVIYDPEDIDIGDRIPADKLCPVPLRELIKAHGGSPIMLNTVALGAMTAIAGLTIEPLLDLIAESFANKAGDLIQKNQAVAKAGFEYAGKNCRKRGDLDLSISERPRRILLEGNEAIAMGAIKAGCRFYAAYPMTPASSILHFMAEQEERFQIVVKHAEDEIAVMNMAIGASFAGVRSMVATSGGGFSLMVEALGLAGISETPVVAVEGQRVGPATGMPTWHEQGDAFFVLNAAQGEFPRVVLTPGDNEECFYFAHDAFNIAEILQTPVIILVDQYICESHQTSEVFDLTRLKIDRGKILSDSEAEQQEDYHRYRFSEDGISPRAIPGQAHCRHIANSYEHDEYGYSNEDASIRAAMNEKRMRKYEKAASLVPKPKRYGALVPKIGIIGWGSTKRPILQALSDLGDRVSVGYLHVTCLDPFPVEDVERFIQQCDYPLVIENNYTGQLSRLMRMNGIEIGDLYYRRYDGRPMTAAGILRRIEEVDSVGA